MGRGSQDYSQAVRDQRKSEHLRDRFADVLGTTRGTGHAERPEQVAAQEAAKRDRHLRREVDEHGDVRYYNHQGLLHRETGPAVERANGTREWYQNEEPHRIDGPAFEGADGARYWYQRGQLHRVDGPAMEWADGTHQWWCDGKLHREDGPAVEWANGEREWYQHDELHRDDGPAIERPDGTQEWYRHGERFWPKS